MKIILFYILRKFFVKLDVNRDSITLEKRLFIRKIALLNRRDIVREQTSRTSICA